MYRADWDAAVARVQALERELAGARQERAGDQATILELQEALTRARADADAQARWFRAGPAVPDPMMQHFLPSNATAVLVIGILSMTLCSLLGPVAWAMGVAELRRIDQGVANPFKRSNATVGMVCGVVATLLLGLVVLWVLVTLASGPSLDY